MLGILLAGIVATQVEILKLGASMGRAIEQTTTLTSQNEQLRDSVATLSDDQRIERLASAMGMVLPPPGAVGYLDAGPSGDVSGALGNIHSPDPASFVALIPRDGDGAMVTGPGTSTLPPPAGVAPTVTTPGASTDTTATTGSGTTDGSAGAQTSTTSSQTTQETTTATQAPPVTSSVPAAPTQATTDSSQTPTDTGSSATAGQSSQASTSGAAAIQPSDSSQQSAGG